MYEAYRTQSRLGCETGSSLAQHLLDHPQEDVQHGGDGTRITLDGRIQEVPDTILAAGGWCYMNMNTGHEYGLVP
jgi:hypothetical protein